MDEMKRKLLIIRSGALGDTLLMLPALLEIQKDTEILFVGRDPWIRLLRPFLYKTINFETGRWFELYAETEIDEPIVEDRFNDLIFFTIKDQPEFQEKVKRLIRADSYHFFPPFPKSDTNLRHMIQFISQCLKDLGFNIDPEEVLARSFRGLGIRKEFMKASGNHFILFHPGSGSEKKNYSPSFWIGLIKETKGIDKKILLGPSELRLYEIFKSLSDKRHDIELIKDISIERVPYLITGSLLYIGHDSGITHLSAMLETPTISLFRQRGNSLWYPIGPKTIIIEGMDEDERLLNRVKGMFQRFLGDEV